MDDMTLHKLFIRDDATSCATGNDYDGRIGLRISAIFVILIGSTIGMSASISSLAYTDTRLGALFPVFAKRHKSIGIPDWAFFIAKYFGSGVIVATAFIHVS
jgi:solute carrier family 39 (zinc transporter), member 1/2/3